MDFRTFVRILFTRWMIVVAAIVACLAGAAAVTALQTKTYESSATILMSFSGATTINELYEATETSQQRLSSYAEIAGGRSVAQRAINQVGAPLTPDELVDNTKVAYTPESMVFRLTVVDSDPRRVAALAAAMADQFADLVPEVEATTADQQPGPTATATVVERPVVPEYPVRPVPARNMALGLIAGVLLGIALALLRNAADRTVRSRETLEEVSELPTLAELPRPRKSGYGESIRGLRTRVAGSQVRSVLITGPAMGAGATTTALSLATSLTEIDEGVLLVEGDPRQAVLAGQVGIESSVGIAEVMADSQALDDAVHPASDNGLWVMASRTPTDPDRHIATPVLPRTIEKLSASFDRVVVDGPPALVTADAALLAAAVEATVLVVRAGSTTVDEVRTALEGLRAAGGNVIGTVLTNARVSRHTSAATRAYRAKVGSAA